MTSAVSYLGASVAMVDYSADDDSDEELGAYIYRTSHTAKFFREKEELVRNNDKTSTNHKNKSNSIHAKKRKKQLEAENTSAFHQNRSNVRRRRGRNILAVMKDVPIR